MPYKVPIKAHEKYIKIKNLKNSSYSLFSSYVPQFLSIVIITVGPNFKVTQAGEAFGVHMPLG